MNLYLTCIDGHVEQARTLIAAKADVNYQTKYGLAALHAACQNGHVECARLLIESKADVHLRDENGYTGIVYAVRTGQLECFYLVLDATTTTGDADELRVLILSTALLMAIMFHQEEMTMALLHAGARIVATIPITLYDDDRARLAAATQCLADTFAYANDFHEIANKALSEDTVVDTRIGRGDNGLYQEPLERVLGYLGLSMIRDQYPKHCMLGGAQNLAYWARRRLLYKKSA